MERLPRWLAVPLVLGSACLVLTQPAWSLLQIGSYAVLATGLLRLLGPIDAFLIVSSALALQGSSTSSENPLRFFLLPAWSLFAACALLAHLVARRPSLGRRVELGPFGPGGA